MIITIAKKFDFDAAHFLPKVPGGHKCKRLHGHTYVVEAVLSGPVDERGMVVDYAEIEEAWKRVHARIDHRLLNEIIGLENPTTEVLAPWIFRELVHGAGERGERFALPLVSVKVFESSTTWCEARL
jgi:6-pyruvoyltetrahydropterin/6-carboxytetrahydropterin synthase